MSDIICRGSGRQATRGQEGRGEAVKFDFRPEGAEIGVGVSHKEMILSTHSTHIHPPHPIPFPKLLNFPNKYIQLNPIYTNTLQHTNRDERHHAAGS